MSTHRDVVRARFRAYMLKVVVWLVVAGFCAMFLLAFASRALGDMPAAMGALSFATMLGVVGGALRIHNKNVRCPACDAWLVPLGMNGFTPTKCPKCGADLS